MTLFDLNKALDELSELLDGSISGVTDAATKAQQAIYETIIELVNRFEIRDGRFVTTQDYAGRIAALQRKMEKIIGELYTPALSDYFPKFRTIESTMLSLHKSYNDLEIELDLISGARKTVYNQAKYYLTEGLADAYIQPAKYLLMQHVSTGISIKDSERIMRKWNDGELSSELTSNRPTPNLQKYATQISRDSAYGYAGAIQEVIKDEFKLDKFIYTGDIIEDSRPLCKHLVGLKRPIDLDEIPKLLVKYPQGLYPNTSKKNFINVRGGYGCRHLAMPVR